MVSRAHPVLDGKHTCALPVATQGGRIFDYYLDLCMDVNTFTVFYVHSLVHTDMAIMCSVFQDHTTDVYSHIKVCTM